MLKQSNLAWKLQTGLTDNISILKRERSSCIPVNLVFNAQNFGLLAFCTTWSQSKNTPFCKILYQQVEQCAYSTDKGAVKQVTAI